MKEVAEFRINEKHAQTLFSNREGRRLGDMVRKVFLATNDPRFELVGKLQRELDASDELFYYGWDITRRYTRGEMEAAQCFRVYATPRAVFEPDGEDCGTEFDKSVVCPVCGSGVKQVSDLRLDLRKVPKSKDIACTIAEEYIVSQRAAELIAEAGLKGFELRRVRHRARYEEDSVAFDEIPSGREILRRAQDAGVPHPTWEFWIWLNRAENVQLTDKMQAEYAAAKRDSDRRRGKPAPIWYQLVVTSPPVEIVPPTRLGIDLFDEDPKGQYRCPMGDMIGLNVLSELYISAKTRGDADIFMSRQFVGTRQILFISQKARRLLETEKLKGLEMEVAHLV